MTNGNINTYPLGFTIPVGYNLSDMIFTWQNLGQSNVSEASKLSALLPFSAEQKSFAPNKKENEINAGKLPQVNYSISLVIGNIQAVEAPLINITRSGLIPKHEQGKQMSFARRRSNKKAHICALFFLFPWPKFKSLFMALIPMSRFFFIAHSSFSRATR